MKHLKEANMGYFKHLWFAWTTALGLILHGLFPMILTTWASDRLMAKRDEIVQRKS